jgi:hypothetical protein
MTTEGQCFAHDGVVDHWAFYEVPGDIHFWLDNGAEFRAVDTWIDGFS